MSALTGPVVITHLTPLKAQYPSFVVRRNGTAYSHSFFFGLSFGSSGVTPKGSSLSKATRSPTYESFGGRSSSNLVWSSSEAQSTIPLLGNPPSFRSFKFAMTKHKPVIWSSGMAYCRPLAIDRGSSSPISILSHQRFSLSGCFQTSTKRPTLISRL
jgi:hypothetical protein